MSTSDRDQIALDAALIRTLTLALRGTASHLDAVDLSRLNNAIAAAKRIETTIANQPPTSP